MKAIDSIPKSIQPVISGKKEVTDKPNSGRNIGISTNHHINNVRNSLPKQEIDDNTTSSYSVIEPKLSYNLNNISLYPTQSLALQTKLSINTPGDEHEREADAVADKIMRMTEETQIEPKFSAKNVMQRKCATCGKEEEVEEPHQQIPLQRKCAECEEEEKKGLQRKESNYIKPEVPNSVLQTLQSSGQPLDSTIRAYMEPRFGFDFGKVKIHTDKKASESASAVHAKAYTVGHNVVFNTGQYNPQQDAGKHLLAHELTHVIQQKHASAIHSSTLEIAAPKNALEHEAQSVANNIGTNNINFPTNVKQHSQVKLAREPLDIDTISADTQQPAPPPAATTAPQGTTTAAPPSLYVKYNGMKFGEVAKAADYPASFTVPKDKTKRVKTKPKADAKPTLSSIPVNAHFFPTLLSPNSKGRALIIGGFHGDEQPGWQMAEGLVDILSKSKGLGFAFDTIVIPRLNAAAIADELAGVKLWRNRCNRQLVDLNRNFPTGNTPKDTDCANTDGAPIQPEVQAVMNIITKFKPDRIVSTHAISTASEAGIFADPNTDPKAIELARGMASTLVNSSDRPFNRLGTGPKDFNPVYPLDTPGVVGAGTSLGAWAPTAVPGQTTPVITIEAPKFGALKHGKGSDERTVEGFARPLQAAIVDPADLATEADRNILKDIDAFSAAEKIGFLTGFASKEDAIIKRIQMRLNTAIENLKALKPPVPISPIPGLRLFKDGSSSQSNIVFEKFFLTGSRASGWDTLPNQFFKGGIRKDGVDRSAWLKTPSKDRLNIIIQFSSLPGTSRHHWGTDVDLNSVEVTDWQPAVGTKPEGKFFKLGQWLQANAAKVGLIQSYTAGRTGGYNEEPWHYSYAPISKGLRDRYNANVNLDTDVIAKIVTEFTAKAKAEGQTVPADFEAGLKQINLSDLVNNIGPGL